MPMLPVLLAAAVAAAPTADIVTAVPLDTLQRCMTIELARDGRTTAINSASGVVLDYAFQSVAPDGKVATAHVAFAIDDLGTQRRITATAPGEPDAVLARQMLHETAKTCIGDADAHIAE
jgi:hypothetical protein